MLHFLVKKQHHKIHLTTTAHVFVVTLIKPLLSIWVYLSILYILFKSFCKLAKSILNKSNPFLQTFIIYIHWNMSKNIVPKVKKIQRFLFYGDQQHKMMQSDVQNDVMTTSDNIYVFNTISFVAQNIKTCSHVSACLMQWFSIVLYTLWKYPASRILIEYATYILLHTFLNVLNMELFLMFSWWCNE